MSSGPKDINLYNRIKKKYQEKMKNSAYRSNLIVKEYKKEYKKKHKKSNAYSGKKNKNTGLSAWNKSKWRNQRGEVGYKKKGDVYRPTVKVSKKTPKTYKELGGMKSKRIKKAMKEKKKTGRVKKF